jgi:hypothetical protein
MDCQQPEFSMTARTIVARIVKLETTRRRPDEILLVWRRPNGDVARAVANADYAPGDKVICAEWLGDSEMPPPRWYGDRLLSQLDRPEQKYITQSLERLVAAEPWRDAGFAPIAAPPAHRVSELRDNELLHICLGVET